MRINNIVLVFSICAAMVLSCQANDTNENIVTNTVIASEGMDTILASEYIELVEMHIDRFEQPDLVSMDTTLAIKLVKIYNTAHLAVEGESAQVIESKKSFIDFFKKKVLNLVLETLECTYGKGMTIYSVKHDLYVGVPSEYRPSDYLFLSK
jgi:hypothetical protein